MDSTATTCPPNAIGKAAASGSITGVPGRNAAMVMLSDLGHDPEEVMSGAGRARAGSH